MLFAVNMAGLGRDVGETLLIALIVLVALAVGGWATSTFTSQPLMLRGLIRLVATIRFRTAVSILAICGGVVIAVGSAAALFDLGDTLRLNREHSLPSAYAVMLFFIAAILAMLSGWHDDATRRPWWYLLALTFAAFGFSEGAELHERIEVQTGLPTLVIIAPLGAAAGTSMLKLAPAIKANRTGLNLLVVALFMWVASQAIDPFHAGWKSILEESLEMTGTSLTILSMLLFAKDALPSSLLRDRHVPA